VKDDRRGVRSDTGATVQQPAGGDPFAGVRSRLDMSADGHPSWGLSLLCGTRSQNGSRPAPSYACQPRCVSLGRSSSTRSTLGTERIYQFLRSIISNICGTMWLGPGPRYGELGPTPEDRRRHAFYGPVESKCWESPEDGVKTYTPL
jgi:hypothetical protein